MKLKNDLIQVRVSESERERARQEAEKIGVSVSEWIRKRITQLDSDTRLARIESILTDLQRRIK